MVYWKVGDNTVPGDILGNFILLKVKINSNQMKNDPHSYDRNFCNCVKKPEKNSGLQWGLNPWPRDTGATLYQLSYEATDVGSRSILGSYICSRERYEGEWCICKNKLLISWTKAPFCVVNIALFFCFCCFFFFRCFELRFVETWVK